MTWCSTSASRASATFASALAALLAFAPLQAAATDCEPTTAEPDVDVGQGNYRFYAEVDCVLEPCLTAVWMYQESNGIDGLQRQDRVWDNTCGGQIEPDTLVFE